MPTNIPSGAIAERDRAALRHEMNRAIVAPLTYAVGTLVVLSPALAFAAGAVSFGVVVGGALGWRIAAVTP